MLSLPFICLFFTCTLLLNYSVLSRADLEHSSFIGKPNDHVIRSIPSEIESIEESSSDNGEVAASMQEQTVTLPPSLTTLATQVTQPINLQAQQHPLSTQQPLLSTQQPLLSAQQPRHMLEEHSAQAPSRTQTQAIPHIPEIPKSIQPTAQPPQTPPPIDSSCDSFFNKFTESYNLGGATRKYKASICTRVKNEAAYMDEWILYNWLVLRVSHFYIYDDSSEDSLKAILQPYIERGIVTYIFWNQNRTVDRSKLLSEPQYTLDQRFCIADCTTNYKASSDWLAFWDVDEFAYLTSERFTDLPDFLDNYVKKTRWDSVLIPWYTFGSSNHTESPEGLITSNYRWRNPLLLFGVKKEGGRFNGKVLYKSTCIPISAVHLEDLPGSGCVQGPYPNRLNSDPKDYPIHIKHYWSKSFQDYTRKLEKWQNAHWFRKELKELTQEKFEATIKTENLDGAYDVDMLKYAFMLERAIKCVKRLR